MSNKCSFSIAIMNPKDIQDINQIIVKYADTTLNSSSHFYFDKQPINFNQIHHDFIFFQISYENESFLNEKLEKMIGELDKLNTDYILRNEKNGKMLVFLDFSGELIIKFDNLNIIKKDTFKKIDELKLIKNEFGYCKGFKPTFRPMELKPIDSTHVKPEKIYLFSNSSENLLKLKEFLSKEIMKIDSEFELDFTVYSKSLVEKLYVKKV